MPKLYDLAHCRAGDKGNTSILSLIAYRADDYPLLAERVTVDAVAQHLRGIVQGDDPPLRAAAARRAAIRLRALAERRRHDVAGARRARQVAVVRAARDGDLSHRCTEQRSSLTAFCHDGILCPTGMKRPRSGDSTRSITTTSKGDDAMRNPCLAVSRVTHNVGRPVRAMRMLIALALLTLGAVPWAVKPSAATTLTFNPTGAAQTFTVPAGVTTLHASRWGAPGATGPPRALLAVSAPS